MMRFAWRPVFSSTVTLISLVSGCVAAVEPEAEGDKAFDESSVVDALKVCSEDVREVRSRFEHTQIPDVVLPFEELQKTLQLAADFPSAKLDISLVFDMAEDACAADRLEVAYDVIGLMKGLLKD